VYEHTLSNTEEGVNNQKVSTIDEMGDNIIRAYTNTRTETP